MTLNQYILVAFVGPEGVYAAPPGTIALEVTNGLLYVKMTGTGTTGWLRVLAADVPSWTVARPIKYNNSGILVTEKIDPNSAADIDAAAIASGSIVKSTGAVLAAASGSEIATALGTTTALLAYLSGLTDNVQAQFAGVVAQLADLQTQINGKADAGVATGAASAGTPHTHTQQ